MISPLLLGRRGALASSAAVTPSPYATSVMTDIPRAYWKLQETGSPSQMADASGNALHLTDLASLTYGVVGGPVTTFETLAVTLADLGGRARTATPGSTVTDNFTIELFVKPTGAFANRIIFNNGDAVDDGYYVRLSTNGKIQAAAAGVAFLSEGTAVLSAGTWYHIAVVRSAGTWIYYLNGAVDLANAGTSAPNAPTTKTELGQGDSNTQAGDYAHAAFYETALSSARIAAHYNARDD